MKLFHKNKKGGLLDTAMVMLFFLIIVIFALVFMKVVGSYNATFQTSGAPTFAKNLQANLTADIYNKADGAMIFYFIIIIVGAWITAFFMDAHPLYFIIFGAMCLLTFYIVIPFVNVLYSLQVATDFITEISYLPKTFFIIDHYAAFLALYTITTALILYAKFKYTGRGQFG